MYRNKNENKSNEALDIFKLLPNTVQQKVQIKISSIKVETLYKITLFLSKARHAIRSLIILVRLLMIE